MNDEEESSSDESGQTAGQHGAEEEAFIAAKSGGTRASHGSREGPLDSIGDPTIQSQKGNSDATTRTHAPLLPPNSADLVFTSPKFKVFSLPQGNLPDHEDP